MPARGLSGPAPKNRYARSTYSVSNSSSQQIHEDKSYLKARFIKVKFDEAITASAEK